MVVKLKFLTIILNTLILGSVLLASPVLAVYTSNSIITRVGNPLGPAPTIGNGSLAGYATTLAQEIDQSCPNGTVDKLNKACLGNTNPAIDSTAMGQLLFELGSRFYYLQCTDFVQAVVAETTGTPLPWNPAKDYVGYSGNGFTWIPNDGSTSIEVGDIPIWTMPPFGHIAIVTSVDSPTQFTVADANYVANGKVAIHPLPLNDPNLAGWLRKI